MNVRVIELKKYYKWICLFLTCSMCILSVRVLILEPTQMIAQANGAGKDQDFVQADKKKNTNDNLLILILNKTISTMEVNYEKENGTSSHKEFMKMALEKIINFDYEDPKTLFKAQISILKEADEDLAEMDDYLVLNNNLQNKEQVNRETNYEKDYLSTKEVAQNNNDENNEAIKAKDIKPVNNPSNNEKETIQIISSPIKMPNKVKLDMKKPIIFVYHTHATESYMPEAVGNFHSLNRKYTVRAVGDQLSSYLKNRGYQVIHDDTMHDYPSYQQSYVRSLETLQTNLKKNASLKIIFDIHRDAAANNDSARENSYVMIHNQKVAKFSIVVGTGNENAEKLLTFAEYIKAKSDELYPGLAKKTITKPYKFNQFNSDYYALIEIGNTANHIDESLRTTKYVSEILDQVIKDIKE